MKHGTNIEWTHVPGYKGETLNISTGCDKVSAGCKFCYAERDWRRLATFPQSPYFGRGFNDVKLHPERLAMPGRWKKPRSIFVNSMSDIFHEKLHYGFLSLFFGEMLKHDRHIYIILTKRADRMEAFIDCFCVERGLEKLPAHIWMGVSVENQDAFSERVLALLDSRVSTRFLSCEPLLGDLNLSEVIGPYNCMSCGYVGDKTGGDCQECDPHCGREKCPECGDSDAFGFLENDPFSTEINWIITGGESGPMGKHRPANPDWFRSIRDQCAGANVPLFHKQNGGSSKCKCCGAWGCRKMDGQFYNEFPKYLSE